ncbi:hypothetical protein [Methanomethylophilus alvi]|uniref:hypothetical protein n=1 Tax=Methanomethylophilus alvi TaxID=1291540 RepID=UPI0037DD2E04
MGDRDSKIDHGSSNDVLLPVNDPFPEIQCLDVLEYSQSGGDEEGNNYQVFTPITVVNDMIDKIGRDYLDDIKTTVLEPTSGEGIFVANILKSRLNKLRMNPATYKANSLRALSTLYSIEIDERLVIIQRSNIYTVFCNSSKELGILDDEQYFSLAKKIIHENIMWAAFNMTEPNILSIEVGYKMPPTKKKKVLEFPVWTIGDDLDCKMKMEEFEHEWGQ